MQKQGDLRLDVLGKDVLRPAEEDVRLDADFPEGLDAVLGGLGLHLPRRLDEGNPGQVDEDGVLPSHLVAELADGLQEGQTLDIPHGPADLHDGHIESFRGGPDEILDLVGDVGNDLHRLAQVVTPALLGDDGVIDLAGREVVAAAHARGGEPLVMPQVQVRLGSVVGDEDLSVLERAHGARIDVDVGIQFLVRDPESPRFQERRDGRRGQPFSQGGKHPARDEDEFGRFHNVSSICLIFPAITSGGSLKSDSRVKDSR